MSEKLNRTLKSVWSRMNGLRISKPEPSIGDKFGKLTILDKYIENNGRQNKTMVSCHCDCGRNYKGILSQISNGYVSSCGCLSGCHNKEDFIKNGKNFSHGLTNHALYSTWNGMKNRCFNKNVTEYHNYGGRGITICEEWLDFRNFYNWCIDNGYNELLTLDRKNNDGNYCPENCKFSTYEEQQNNKSSNTILTAFGEVKTMSQWSKDIRCKVTYGVLCYRINNNWEHESAITEISEKSENYKFVKWLKEFHPESIEQYNDYLNS